MKESVIYANIFQRRGIPSSNIELESTPVTKDGRTLTVAWALFHALEHATLHLGQVQLTRQLWEQTQSDVYVPRIRVASRPHTPK